MRYEAQKDEIRRVIIKKDIILLVADASVSTRLQFPPITGELSQNVAYLILYDVPSSRSSFTSCSWVACLSSCCCWAFLTSCTHFASAWASRTCAAPSSFASLVQSASFVDNSACASSSSRISSCSVLWHFKRSRRASISSACCVEKVLKPRLNKRQTNKKWQRNALSMWTI